MIAILGEGAFGTALGGVLKENGYKIAYYDSRVLGEKLTGILEKAEVILVAVPSKVLPFVLPDIPDHNPLIIATKGVLDIKLLDRFEDVMVLSGPGFADDIKRKCQTHLTASDDRVIEMFKTDYLTFDKTQDVKGILMCGALKNVYAIAAGLKDLQKGTSEWRRFVNQALEEMKKLLIENGAIGETVDFACGIGDLELTCAYPSRNYEFGQKRRLNPEYQPEKTVEGFTALGKIRDGVISLPEDVPILRELMTKVI